MKCFIIIVIVVISNTFLGVAKPMKIKQKSILQEDASGEQNIS